MTETKRLQSIHPLAKLFVTVLYIMLVVSFEKYDLVGLVGMSLYIVFWIIALDISIRDNIKPIMMILALVCVVGIANPFYDREVMYVIGTLHITGGMISMVTLMLKGVFAVMASYILMMTTDMEQICYALRIIHVPKEIVTTTLLIYRYMGLFQEEVKRMTQAYKLRAPMQKGIHISVWGTFTGQLLLRSVDRAQIVYESMLMRGYDGEFRGNRHDGDMAKSIIYVIIAVMLLMAIRIIPIFTVVGSMFA